MHTDRRPLFRIVLPGALLLGLIGAAWRAGAAGAASPAARAPAPSVVVVCDFQRVYDGLQEIKDRNVRLGEQGGRYQDELKRLDSDIRAMETDLKNSRPNSEEWVEKRIALQEAREQASSRQSGINKRVDILIGNTNHEIYMKFLGTISFLAQREGWDIVLLDDRALIPFPDLAPSAAVFNTVTQKKVLFASERIDVTDVVVNQMNVDYAVNPPVDRSPPAPQPKTANP